MLISFYSLLSYCLFEAPASCSTCHFVQIVKVRRAHPLVFPVNLVDFNKIGHQNLLPAAYFYLSMESDLDGFSLQYILDLPLPDQQLWLHALQQARACGSSVFALKMARMRSSLHTWSIPTPPAHYLTSSCFMFALWLRLPWRAPTLFCQLTTGMMAFFKSIIKVCYKT